MLARTDNAKVRMVVSIPASSRSAGASLAEIDHSDTRGSEEDRRSRLIAVSGRAAAWRPLYAADMEPDLPSCHDGHLAGQGGAPATRGYEDHREPTGKRGGSRCEIGEERVTRAVEREPRLAARAGIRDRLHSAPSHGLSTGRGLRTPESTAGSRVDRYARHVPARAGPPALHRSSGVTISSNLRTT